jgi:hypothetical protein
LESARVQEALGFELLPGLTDRDPSLGIFSPIDWIVSRDPSASDNAHCNSRTAVPLRRGCRMMSFGV